AGAGADGRSQGDRRGGGADRLGQDVRGAGVGRPIAAVDRGHRVVSGAGEGDGQAGRAGVVQRGRAQDRTTVQEGDGAGRDGGGAGDQGREVDRLADDR